MPKNATHTHRKFHQNGLRTHIATCDRTSQLAEVRPQIASHALPPSPFSDIIYGWSLGDWNARAKIEPLEHEDFDIELIKVNQDFHPKNFNNDIALIKLDRPVTFKKHIQPVCLPDKDELLNGKTGYVTGWGRTMFKKSARPSILQQAEMNIISAEFCQLMFK